LNGEQTVKHDLAGSEEQMMVDEMIAKTRELDQLKKQVEKGEGQDEEMLGLVRDKAALLKHLINHEKVDDQLRTYIK